MPLVAGTVTIAADPALPNYGTVTGAGYALELYEAEAATLPQLSGAVADHTDLDTIPEAQRPAYRTRVVELRVQAAAKCTAQATATVALIHTATVLVTGVTAGGATAPGTVL